MPYEVVGFGETMLRLTPPHGGRLEGAPVLVPHVAGSESNVLCCLSRLGMSCAWISSLPDNPPGRTVEAELRRHGVDTSGVLWADGGARLGIFYAEECRAPLGAHVYYDRAGSAFARADPASFELSLLDSTRFLHLSGITPALGKGPRAAFSRFLEAAYELGVAVSFDVNYRARLWEPEEASRGIEEACRASSVLICSAYDAKALWGFEGEPARVLELMAHRFGEKKSLVLTLGESGAAELRDGCYDAAPAFISEGHARYGSGDAFTAGYLRLLARSVLREGT